MKSTHTLTLSKKKYVFNILNSIQADIEVKENPYDLPLDQLFTMAARINKKRSFLFVSKLIGKHIPINPRKGLQTSALLASRYLEVVKGMESHQKSEFLTSFLLNEYSFNDLCFIPSTYNPLIIGFAETATALGHAFFNCFERADFFHTTRESLQNQAPVITFEEEHSHATSHRCYLPLELIQNEREIILVDDELTTGKTALNIIRSIQSKFPRKEYTIVSILDWRSAHDKDEFKKMEKSLNIKIHVVSLIAGNFRINNLQKLQEHSSINETIMEAEPIIEVIQMNTIFSKINDENHSFIEETGRFSISHNARDLIQQKIVRAGSILKEKRSGERTLCLGTGEFMYLPMKLAAEMGTGISYQSTTRSPIYIQNQDSYGVRFGLAFPNPENQDVSHFVYNIPPSYYDDLFLFFEQKVDDEALLPFLKELRKTQINSIKIVFFTD